MYQQAVLYDLYWTFRHFGDSLFVSKRQSLKTDHMQKILASTYRKWNTVDVLFTSSTLFKRMRNYQKKEKPNEHESIKQNTVMINIWNTYLILWIIAMLWICHCLRMESQISFIFFLAIGLYASYSSRRTFFPSKLSLVIPSKINFSQIILGNMFQNKKIEKSSIWTKNLAKPSSSLFHFDHEWILCRLKIKVISLHEKQFDCQCISNTWIP